jgi:hypothetical protein
MPRPNKRSALAVLTRARLVELADIFELDVRRSGSKPELVDDLARSKRASFENVLEAIKREELKEICRAHGLDDSGREKQVIVDRILGREEPAGTIDLFEAGDEEAEEHGTVDGRPSLVTVLPMLNRRQLAALGQDIGLDLLESQPKEVLVEALLGAEQLDLAQVLDPQGRDDLRKICRAHGLSGDDRQRSALIERLLAAATGAPLAPPSEYTPPPGDGSSPATEHLAAATPVVFTRPVPVSASLAELPAPGELVHVRHRQYLVEDVVPPPEPGHMTRVRMVCLDDDNQGRVLEVLWELELGARRIDPAAQGLGHATRLDPPRHFAGYLHAVKWNCVTATDAKLFQAPFRAGVKLFQHQLAPLRKALELPRANLFIADDVGLGKTVEAGLVMQELLLRQRLDFVLIVAPATITLQWRTEMERRFGLRFEIYNRSFVATRRQERGFGVNPWSTHNRFIISYQTLRRPEYREPLLTILGDRARKSLLVLDEAHTVAPASSTKYAIDSQMTKVARDIAPRFENRLFLSATPHNGHSNSFSALLEILDPQRFTRGVKVDGPEALEPVMVRRLKSDLRDQGFGTSFPRRRLVELQLRHESGRWHQHRIVDAVADPPAPLEVGEGTDAELQLSQLLAQYTAACKPKRKRGKLVFISLQKRLLSCVEAFFRTLSAHASAAGEHLEAEREPDTAKDDVVDADAYGTDDDGVLQEEVADATREIEPLEASPRELLRQMLDLARKHRFDPGAKALAVLDWIRRNQCAAAEVGGADLSKGRGWTDTRLIIFTEYADTKRYLQQLLAAAIAGTERDQERILTFHGGMSDDQREEVQAAFLGDPAQHPVRILIATDAAREGINLQERCADLIHFDIPWNPARMEQRNGRIDRTLQPKPEVRCMYFVLPQRTEDRVLRTVVEKTARIAEELGSLSSVVMDRIEGALAEGIDAETEDRIERAATVGGRIDTVKEELEAPRGDRSKLGEEIEACGRMLENSRRQLEFEEVLLRDAIEVGLQLSGVGPMRPAGAEGMWTLPDLGGSWEGTLDSLRRTRKRGELAWEWRKDPLLPVSFTPGDNVSLDRVHLHLQHPFVQRVLSRFVAQGYSAHDLARVTMVRTKYSAAARVVAFGRLSLFGRGATRLHDRVIPIVAPWLEGKGKTHLQPFGSDGDREALIRFEDALREAPGLEEIAAAVQGKLLKSAPEDFATLWTHIEAEADAEEHDARGKLAERGRKEAAALRRILERQKQAIEKSLAGTQMTLELGDGELEESERRQVEADRKHMRERLVKLEKEMETEPGQIEQGYEVVARRLEPIGLVYLWPHTR